MKSLELEKIKRSTLTVKEVAEYLGISVEMIYLLVREKSIVHFRINSRILFKREAVDKWVEDKMISGIDENENG